MKNKNTVRFISIFLSLILLLFSWTETAYAADLAGLYLSDTTTDSKENTIEDISGDTTENTTEDTTESTSADTLEDISADISDNSITDTANEIFTDISDNGDISNNTLFDNLYENTIYSSESFPEDLLPMELEYIPYSQTMAYFEPIETENSDSSVASAYTFAESTEQLLTSQSYESSWEQYGCYYVYNMLSDEDKLVWDKLSEFCIAVLDSTETKSNTGIVSYGSTDFEHLKSVAYMFRYSNPQYFFLKNSVVYTKKTVDDETTYYVGLGIYDAFQDGAARKEAAEAFFAQLESWTVQVEALDTELEKVLTIQNLICEKVEYDSEFASSSNAEQLEQEKTKFTQSAYSTLCMDTTVCAGYAQGFELLANAVGIDTIAVTSRGHEWNQVRINDSWYNLDCTWADKSTYVWQKYTLKSNAFYENDNSSHIMASFWNGYTPPCTRDSSFSGMSLPGVIPEGTLPQPLGKLDAPAISSEGIGSVCTVSITQQTDADIYYTLNSVSPSSSFSKSERYEGPISVNRGDLIRAVAIKDCYNDSEVVTLEVTANCHTITYFLDGGVNASQNPEFFYQELSGSIQLKEPTKTGYSFLGWYLDSAFKMKVTEIDLTAAEDIFLYAAWKINTYTVIFDYDGVKKNQTLTYDYGSTLETPAEVKREGYRFLGWEIDQSLWNFSTDTVTKNLTLKACWIKIYQVEFTSSYGEVPQPQMVDEGTLLQEPEINRKGYTLIGWYPENRETPWDFRTDRVSGDLKLEAKWELSHYKVTFDAGAGKCSFTEKEVVYSQPYGDMPEVFYEGHLFDGWYLSNTNQRVEENTPVLATDHHVLSANWITMDTCSAPLSSVVSSNVYYGTEITLSCKTEGVEIYYTLDGTMPDSDNGILFTDAIVLKEDTLIKAIARKKDYLDSHVSEYTYEIIMYQCEADDITEEDLKEYADSINEDVHSLTNDMLPEGLWAAGLKDQVYNGKKITCPDMHVYYGTKLLTYGKDYTLHYSSNLKPGQAAVLIKGKGAYKGSCRAYFTILPADIQKAEVDDVVLFYTTEVQKGKPVVYYELNGKRVKLKAGRDFVYEYPGTEEPQSGYNEQAFKNIGTYYIMIRGKGNYQGTRIVTETIRQPYLPASEEQTFNNLKPEPITRQTVYSWVSKVLKYIYY